MAIKLKTNRKGITTDFYIRVVNPLPNKNAGILTFGLEFCADSSSPPIDTAYLGGEVFGAEGQQVNVCPYSLGGGDPWAQAYVYLKTLPEFAGAEDC